MTIRPVAVQRALRLVAPFMGSLVASVALARPAELPVAPAGRATD